MSATVSQFVHSSDFWRWHGFVLSGLWLFGSTVSSVMKQSKMKYHHIPHLIVDYVSFIFMAISVYLMVPQLHLLMKGSNMQIIHVVGGLIFFGLLLYQHFKGIKGWSPDYKVSSNLILFGRILAATGWLIHEEDKMYALGVLGISVLLYTMVERKPELMTKGK